MRTRVSNGAHAALVPSLTGPTSHRSRRGVSTLVGTRLLCLGMEVSRYPVGLPLSSGRTCYSTTPISSLDLAA